jgi:mono/diheme cytochrome c family protein
MRIDILGTMLAFAVGLPLSLISQGPAIQGSQRIPLPLDGAQIFRSYCATCHGADGKGRGPVAGALKHPPSDLTLISRRNGGRFPRDRVKAIIAGQEQSTSAHGSREMPVWGPVFHEVERDQDWGEVRLENVTLFIQSLQQKWTRKAKENGNGNGILPKM